MNHGVNNISDLERRRWLQWAPYPSTDDKTSLLSCPAGETPDASLSNL